MQNAIHWILRLVVAGILLQTLYFKFTAHPDSVYIFEQTGLGAPGRIGIGIMELVASILILYPRTTGLGSFLGLGLMSGAIFFHLTKLGIEVHQDGGLLFYLGVIVFVCCLVLLWLNKEQIRALIQRR